MNLFEQQARQDQRMLGAIRELLGVENSIQFIRNASAKDLHMLAQAMEMRLRHLSVHATSKTAEANLDEAANLLVDVALDIDGAMKAEPDEPHEPGCKCDSCRAAASDVAHGMFVDAQLLKGNHGK